MTDYKVLTDEMLVEFSLIGDERAFAELVSRYEKPVHTAAYGITGNYFSAQDASQDAFVSAWIKLASLNDAAKFRPWLMAIARNSARNLTARYRAVARDIPLDDELVSAIPDDSSEADELRELIDTLDADTRDILKLHYFEGYSVKEIAEKLGQPVGTIKWRLSEGRKKLRKGYGYEEEYDEDEAVTRRVMRQVEKLKLWRFKESKAGFADEYRKVIANVEALKESKDKDNAMADMLVMGYWWIDGLRHFSQVKKIKKLAEKAGNEDALANIAIMEFRFKMMEYYDLHDEHEFDKDENTSSYRAKLIELENSLVEYYAERGHIKAEAALLIELANDFSLDKFYRDAIRCVDRLKDISKDGGFERIFAGEAKKEYVRYSEFAAKGDMDVDSITSINRLSEKSGKLYRWSDASCRYISTNRSRWVWLEAIDPFSPVYDGVIYDRSLKKDEPITSSSGNTVTLISEDETVTVPAGRFENCSVVRLSEKMTNRSKTIYYRPDVGMIKLAATFLLYNPSSDKNEKFDIELSLKSYDAKFEGMIPRAGSRWTYHFSDTLINLLSECEAKIVSDEKNGAISVFCITTDIKTVETASFEEDIAYATYNFNDIVRYRRNNGRLSEILARAESRDMTATQRKMFDLYRRASDRLYRLYEMSNEPEPPVRGLWNEFSVYEMRKDGENVALLDNNPGWHIAYSPFLPSIEGQKLLHNQFIKILSDSTGFLWSEKWKPGYSENYMRDVYGMKDRELSFHFVKGGETVTVPAGTFENCIHIQFDMRGIGNLYTPFGYRGGWADYWFAPGIGLVQHFRLINATYDCYWQLTEYKGTGEGYFPVDDGLFRRYEPADLREGFISSLEVTFISDGSRSYMIYDAEGSQKTEFYNAAARGFGFNYDEYKKSLDEAAVSILPMIVKYDPAGLIKDGGDPNEYMVEARDIVGIAPTYNDIPNGSEEYINEVERILTPFNSDRMPDHEIVCEIAEKAREISKGTSFFEQKVDMDELYGGRLTGEYNDLIKTAEETLEKNDCGKMSQAVAVLSPSRNIHAAFIYDPLSDDESAEDALIGEIRREEKGEMLRVVCMRHDGGIEIPSARLRKKMLELSDKNGFAAVRTDSTIGFKRLGDIE